MSDASGITITDVLGLAKGAQKLLDTIALGVGKFCEPWHVQRMATAKAKEIEIISDAISQNICLPISYNNGEIHINAEDANQLATRAQNRALYQEMRKQQNIENVIAKAYNELKGVDVVSEKPVAPDWVNEFFNRVANISNEQMQTLWAKLLAGEVQQPGQFSMRTLGTLKNLSQEEATLFSRITPYILRNNPAANEPEKAYFLINDDNLQNKYGITFSQIMRLSEAGLFYTNGSVRFGINIQPEETTVISGVQKAIYIKNTRANLIGLDYMVYPLTESGIELYKVAFSSEKGDYNDYLESCLQSMKRRGFGDFSAEPIPNDIIAYIE